MHEVRPAVLIGESSTRLYMYSLDTGTRYSTYIPIFKIQKGSIETLNFSHNYLIDYLRDNTVCFIIHYTLITIEK